MKSVFDDLKQNLSDKIDKETGTLNSSITALSEKIDKGISGVFAEQFHLYFDQRMQRIIGVIFTLAAFAAALYKGLIQSAPQRQQFYWLLGLGVLLLIATLTLTRSPKPPKS
jgi:hypothetical protein